MQRLEVSGAVRPIYGSLGFKRLSTVDPAYLQTYPGYLCTVSYTVLMKRESFLSRSPYFFHENSYSSSDIWLRFFKLSCDVNHRYLTTRFTCHVTQSSSISVQIWRPVCDPPHWSNTKCLHRWNKSKKLWSINVIWKNTFTNDHNPVK